MTLKFGLQSAISIYTPQQRLADERYVGL